MWVYIWKKLVEIYHSQRKFETGADCEKPFSAITVDESEETTIGFFFDHSQKYQHWRWPNHLQDPRSRRSAYKFHQAINQHRVYTEQTEFRLQPDQTAYSWILYLYRILLQAISTICNRWLQWPPSLNQIPITILSWILEKLPSTCSSSSRALKILLWTRLRVVWVSVKNQLFGCITRSVLGPRSGLHIYSCSWWLWLIRLLERRSSWLLKVNWAANHHLTLLYGIVICIYIGRVFIEFWILRERVGFMVVCNMRQTFIGLTSCAFRNMCKVNVPFSYIKAFIDFKRYVMKLVAVYF